MVHLENDLQSKFFKYLIIILATEVFVLLTETIMDAMWRKANE